MEWEIEVMDAVRRGRNVLIVRETEGRIKLLWFLTHTGEWDKCILDPSRVAAKMCALNTLLGNDAALFCDQKLEQMAREYAVIRQ